MNSSDTIYQFDALLTYKYTFNNNKGYMVEEYIHCIVKEHLDKYDGSTPRKIRVNQIHNLEEYFSNPDYNNYSERVLKTDDLQFVNNWKTIR
ncbi:hypothetical protein [Chryseobacterium profundimaris]|uniref:Uncharacterized protein n=1 Tax=Chryseobacterium profundimaris TaxID=1387275 RepID=A0ABY1NSS5_9FLAO|nr:hypothetical protein [Chryseobacterium profundimaris]SMP16357.1 hypothetical protein SAMN06264346_10419 [Chryseobacterium profundimaris]